MKTFRRIDGRKVDQIIGIIQACKDHEIEAQDAIFTEYKKVPDATRLEHALAHYPIYAGSVGTKREIRDIKHDIMQMHNNDVRLFNKSVKDLDMEIIGVAYYFKDVHDKEFKMFFDELAIGLHAKEAADKCDPYINGWKEKKKRLVEISKDDTLKKKHDAKMRAIQKILDNRKGRKK